MAATPTTCAFTAVFDRAAGARLDAAERFVRSLPALFPGELAGCDLAHQARGPILAVVIRFGAGFGAATRQRLDFWCARAGVRATALDRLPPPQRAVFEGNLARCELRRAGVAPADLAAVSRELFTAAGADEARALAAPGRPTLAMDVGGPGWSGVRFDRARGTLFVPGALAPPVGDGIALALRLRGSDAPVEIAARVAADDESAPRGMAGFVLRLDAPEDVAEALDAACAPPVTRAGAEQRAHPRYALKAPVMVEPCDGSEGGDVDDADCGMELDLSPDVLENLSQGGAFVRTASPFDAGARVRLTMRIPGGGALRARAVVVMTNARGMGVRFELDEAGRLQLAAALAQLSARPRRALVVDDDALVRRMLQEALRQRGFDVLTASDGATGLSVLADELLALDLLVADVRMPKMDGETLLRTVRREGGESDLAIVIVTGALEAGLGSRLERDGADAVLDKALGPELIAQAADAVVERKRLPRA
jgi:CheY-like chemotaxis protein